MSFKRAGLIISVQSKKNLNPDVPFLDHGPFIELFIPFLDRGPFIVLIITEFMWPDTSTRLVDLSSFTTVVLLL